jgi:multisubunit Na+/H+ antiporter MnhC subunit
MADQLPEPSTPRTTNEPVEPTGAVARKNVVLGLALTAIVFVMAAGAVVVSLIYLHYD